jgi:tRNA A37 threonylcarbamoyladenosine dehydratase
MLTQFSRSELLLGRESTEILKRQQVAVFGLGGVGSYVVEGLVRSGIGRFVLFDRDVVCVTNLNRQLIATRKSIGMAKVHAMRDRILDINPDAEVIMHECFYGAANALDFDFSGYSYIIDCIDTISSKLIIIEQAKSKNIPIISCMGTGNKLDPTRLELSDINKTSVCPLARVMRQELKKRRIKKLKVLYSREIPIAAASSEEFRGRIDPSTKRPVPGSVAFVPSVAGLIIAGEVIRDLLSQTTEPA